MNKNLFIRLAFAAHRVADALPQEQLKQEIKESANTILADLLVLIEKDGVLPEKKRMLLSQIMKQVDVLLVYFDRAKGQGWMNADNFSVLEAEYGKIKDFLQLFEGMQGEQPAIQKRRDPVVAPAPALKRVEATSVVLTDRQKKILDFLGRKDRAQVWELQKVLPQVTKRTLRRDLDSLLAQNLVARKGEWNAVVYELKAKETVA